MKKQETFKNEEMRMIVTELINVRIRILQSPFVVKKKYVKKLSKIISKLSNLERNEGGSQTIHVD